MIYFIFQVECSTKSLSEGLNLDRYVGTGSTVKSGLLAGQG